MKTTLAIALAAAAVAATTAGAASGTTSAWDKQWLKTSLAGDRFEIAGGKMALQRSHDSAVRALAHRLVMDHTKSLHEGAHLARMVGVAVPSSAEPSMQWELKIVSSLQGTQFDRWYSSLEVNDHVQDIQETSSEVHYGSNSTVRNDARKEIPTLRLHLQLPRKALNST